MIMAPIMMVAAVMMAIITAMTPIAIPAIGGAGAKAHNRRGGKKQKYPFHNLSAFFPGHYFNAEI